MVTATQYTGEFMKEMEQALKGWHKRGAMEVFLEGMTIMRHASLVRKEKLHTRLVLCHKENRGRLMLSPHNAHSNGQKIHKAGADRRQLINAVCIELPATGPIREANVTANIELVRRSNGLLAEVNGTERVLSIGCGHTAAFCKLVATGEGTSPQTDLTMDHIAGGKIDVQKLKQNKEFTAMIEEGWEWEIIPAEVDALFPDFAKVAQKALNVSNQVASKSSELEAAITISALLDNFSEVEGHQQMIVDHIKDLGLSCSTYTKAILDFVRLYGGGETAPQIKFMDNVAKQFNCNVVLGEVFWDAITYQSFPASCAAPCCLLRVCLGLCNLTSPKLEDGIAKLIFKTDIARIFNQKVVDTAKMYEETLGDAVNIVKSIASLPKYDEATTVRPIGQFFVRIGLLASGKEKLGREGKEYTIGQIKAMFLEHISELVGQTIAYAPWVTDIETTSTKGAECDEGKRKEKATPKAAAKASGHKILTPEELTNPVARLTREGFMAGCTVREKSSSSELHNQFTITSIDPSGCAQLERVMGYDGNQFTGHVEFNELLTRWSILTSTSKPPYSMCTCKATRPQSVMTDKFKQYVWYCLIDIDRKHLSSFEDSGAKYWMNPPMLRSGNIEIPIGSLKLVPMTNYNHVSTKSTPQSVSFGHYAIEDGSKVEVCVLPPGKQRVNADKPTEFDNDHGMQVPFWWVLLTTEQSDANMKFDNITVSVNKGAPIKIRILTNSKTIKPYTKICRYVPGKPVATPTLVTDTPPAPKKKQRRSV